MGFLNESCLSLRLLSGKPWICYPRPSLTGSPSSFVSIVRVSPRASRFTRPGDDFLQPLFAPWGRTGEGWEGDCKGRHSRGVGPGWTEGLARSLGTWRARLTWRRLRGEGSAVRELHCEHKAKEGEGRDQAVARLASLGPPSKRKIEPHPQISD